MKTVLCYYSYHHGNTRKVAEAMAAAGDVTLLDVRTTPTADLSGYDCVGLASGIYGFEVHPSVTAFARRESKPLRDMAKAANDFAHGNLEARVRVEEDYSEEVEELAL